MTVKYRKQFIFLLLKCKMEVKFMDVFSVLTMIGGLALFLYGMHTMSDGLSKIVRWSS